MIKDFYLFSDLNRDGKTWTLEEAFSTKHCKIISMGDDEDAYLFSMQLMLGAATIVPFQKFHDDYWCDKNYRKQDLRSYLRGVIFCTHPSLLDYMVNHQGDLQWQKHKRGEEHWSQGKAQHSLLNQFF